MKAMELPELLSMGPSVIRIKALANENPQQVMNPATPEHILPFWP